MRRFAISLLCGVGGYVLSAIAAYVLIDNLSSNMHDRSMEAAMTSIFVIGPVGAIVTIIVAFVRLDRRSSKGAPAEPSEA